MVLQAAEVVKANIPSPAIIGIVPGEEIEEGAHWSPQDVAGSGGE
tara:strand:- start:545 stop:679 length:135 start_codon:yes stop_codon:yes gene_type:complete